MFLKSDGLRNWDTNVRNGSSFWVPTVPTKSIEGQKFRVVQLYKQQGINDSENRTGYYLCTRSFSNGSTNGFEAVASKFLRANTNGIVNGCGDRKWFVPSTRNELIRVFNENDFSGLHQPIRIGLKSPT